MVLKIFISVTLSSLTTEYERNSFVIVTQDILAEERKYAKKNEERISWKEKELKKRNIN